MPDQATGGGVDWLEIEDAGEGEGGSDDCAADDGGEVELGEPAAAEGGFEERAGEPEGEHAEEDAENALVDEGVGEELPELAVDDSEGFEDEMALQQERDVRGEPAEEEQTEEDRDVRKDELASDACKCWKAERDGAGAGHAFFLISS